MSETIIYGVVAAMIHETQAEIRAEIDRTVSELRQELTQMIDEERAMRQDAIDSVYRVLNARTERLV